MKYSVLKRKLKAVVAKRTKEKYSSLSDKKAKNASIVSMMHLHSK